MKNETQISNLQRNSYNIKAFASEQLFIDSTSDDTVLNDNIEQTNETIEYKVNIPEFPFKAMEKYSIMFEELSDTYNISREASRGIRFLINQMLSDETLGKQLNVQMSLFLSTFPNFSFNRPQ
jgi:hypothetical protein